MPAPTFQRFNAKARGSTAGGRSHKKGKRKAGHDEPEEEAPQLQPHHEPGMSSKKRKRLDSYIAKKLQLERRDDTLKTLAALQNNKQASVSMLSSASLGQNPLKPTTALERAERIEDRNVRRGIERLKQRHGDMNDGDSGNDESDDGGRTRGKPRAVEVVTTAAEEQDGIDTTVLETKGERKARERAAAKGAGRLKMPKRADWNPKLSKAKADSESSDFDSSASDNDSASENEDEEAAVKTPPAAATEPEQVAKPASVGSALKPAAVGGALKSSVGGALKPTVGSALGGALKTADGSTFQPRVVVRGPKKFAPARQRAAESSSEEDSDDDDDSEEDSEDEDDMDSEEGSGEGDDDDDENEDSGDDEPAEDAAKPSTGFKAWAQQQMGTAQQNVTPDLLAADATRPKKVSQPLPKTGEFIGPMGATLVVPSTSLLTGGEAGATERPKIKRRPSVVESRMGLPVVAEEQGIVESILMNPVVVICGETGSGKTTQVPQMLYEASFGFKGSNNPGMIAVTQPRRVAAVSLAERVRDELGLDKRSGVVAHQIRYSSTTAPDTAIKFMTDGVLLRELANDFLLSRYSVVVVDEAHERGVNTDVLIGVLSRVARLREKRWREAGADKKDKLSPLRIVIMSATLRVADFAENATLFPTPPPVIHIGARQHPVTMHFSRRTSSDYVGEAFNKVCKIHARLPTGAILVFLTGQSEIMGLCRRLEKKYGTDKSGKDGKGKGKAPAKPPADDGMLAPEVLEAEDVDLGGDTDLAADVDDGVAEEDPEALDTDDEEDELLLEETDAPVTVLPLYSLLPQEQQMAVFKPPPEGHRLIIVATNVAETSLTIPGVRYVVDCGRSKERQYDAASGVQNFAVSWISKASAAQRAGRAGRTGPGHCYRLYSSALFEDHMSAFSQPEILRMPIEGVVLNMKAMNIDAVTNFPFPTPPDRLALKRAEGLLQHLGALDRPASTRMIAGVQKSGVAGGRITDLGRAMAGFPVSPRFAKMLVVGAQHDCLGYIIAIVAGLSVGDPFIHENALDVEEEGSDDDDMDDARKAELSHIRSEEVRQRERRKDLRGKFFKRHAAFDGKGESDMFKLLTAIGAYEHNPTGTFCNEYFLRIKAMQEIQQLRSQISNIAKVAMKRMEPPNDKQRKIIRQILAAGFIDQVAVLESLVAKKGSSSAHASTRGIPYRAIGVPEPVYIHQASALFHGSPPEYIVFTEIQRMSNTKLYVKGVTKIQPAWLAVLGKDMCTFSRPVETAGMKAKAMSGSSGSEREVIVVPHLGDLGVDLPPVKRRQRREGTRWITLDE